jgi:hypothetical protein
MIAKVRPMPPADGDQDRRADQKCGEAVSQIARGGHVEFHAGQRAEPEEDGEAQKDRDAIGHAMQEALRGFGNEVLSR